jgi:hypothetical protein
MSTDMAGPPPQLPSVTCFLTLAPHSLFPALAFPQTAGLRGLTMGLCHSPAWLLFSNVHMVWSLPVACLNSEAPAHTFTLTHPANLPAPPPQASYLLFKCMWTMLAQPPPSSVTPGIEPSVHLLLFFPLATLDIELRVSCLLEPLHWLFLLWLFLRYTSPLRLGWAGL